MARTGGSLQVGPMWRPACRTSRPVVVLAAFLCACGGGGGGSPAAPTASPSPATIGAAGGTVTSGIARLVVPAGALGAPVALVVRVAPAGPLDPHVVGGTTVSVEPAGTTFAAAATLVLGYDPAAGPAGVDPADRRVHTRAAGAWVAVAGGTTDTGAREARASVTAAGTYAVRWVGPQTPCSLPEDRQFDFWLGRWDYHQGNLPLASNDITAEGGGSLVEEHFQDPTGTQGRSVSLFSRTDRLWHQTYVDSRGGRLVLAGSRVGPRMVLNQGAADRFTWDPVDADTVRYFGEHSADGGATWTVTLEARYTRR
jgi:hypothetical protein